LFSGKSAFILKQSSGFLRSFLYIDKVGIVERIYRRNQWSKYNIVEKNTRKNFSAILFPDDEIGILYQDEQGNILITMYDNRDSETYQVYKNDSNEDIYFDAFGDGEGVHIFYTMVNKRTQARAIFYQKLDREFRISPIDIIGNISFEYEKPFTLYRSKKGDLYMIYQRYTDSHCLGYKVLSSKDKIWSKFHVIDHSSEPFIDFSIVESEGKVWAAYIKKEDELNKLNFYRGFDPAIEGCLIDEGSSMSSCSLFSKGNAIWCLWPKENKLCKSFCLENGSAFSTPPWEETIKPETILKGLYLSNSTGSDEFLSGGDIFIFSNSGPEYLYLPDIYGDNKKRSSEDISLEGYISDQALKWLNIYAEELNEKNRLISELRKEIDSLTNKE
jgi:hypothetical protein